jgi:acetyl esterase
VQVIIAGESGGGNLTLATTLKAKTLDTLHLIDGVYAMCPYIYGRYAYGDSEESLLPSLKDNDGLGLNVQTLQLMGSIYTPDGADITTMPLAWPYWATEELLTGLPPHVISVNELDPLKDEGIAYYRKLLHAGVRARGRVVLGTTHYGDVIFFRAAPDICDSTVSDIVTFASSL